MANKTIGVLKQYVTSADLQFTNSSEQPASLAVAVISIELRPSRVAYWEKNSRTYPKEIGGVHRACEQIH